MCIGGFFYITELETLRWTTFIVRKLGGTRVLSQELGDFFFFFLRFYTFSFCLASSIPDVPFCITMIMNYDHPPDLKTID